MSEWARITPISAPSSHPVLLATLSSDTKKPRADRPAAPTVRKVEIIYDAKKQYFIGDPHEPKTIF